MNRGGEKAEGILGPTIGCIYPMGGRAARFRWDAILGAYIAVDEINDSGSERADPKSVLGEVARFVKQDRVDFLKHLV